MGSQRNPTKLQRLDTVLRDLTDGLSSREFWRLFDRDAANAYSVLTREHVSIPEPKGRLRRLLFRARMLFLGLASKLSPPRRALFVLALLLFFIGLLKPQVVGGGGDITFTLQPFWFLTSTGALVFLLALELVDRVRVRDELEVARELQEDLLPRELPPLPGYGFAHSYRTANEVGGDYYDLTPLPDGRLALMVGDASGHGMAAGLVMAIANATLDTALDFDPSPTKVVAMLNRTLCRTGTRRTFLSVFYGVLTPETGHLEYVCAGHPFPLLRRTSGRVEELGCGSLPLGIRDPLEITPCTVTLEPGDLLFLFTDGLAEAINAPQQEAFGFDRVRDLVRTGGPPQSVHDRILRAFGEHIGHEPLRDDLTLLVIARQPFQPPILPDFLHLPPPPPPA